MTDVIKMAEKAGAFVSLSTTPEKDVAFLERFAELIRADTKKQIADRIADSAKECRQQDKQVMLLFSMAIRAMEL
jgi:hypothetical protein